MNARHSTWGMLACLALGTSDLVVLNSTWLPEVLAPSAPEPAFQPSRPVAVAPTVKETAAVALPAAPVEQPPETFEPIVLRFQTNAFALTAEQSSELDRAAQLLLQNPGLQARIAGHADRRGAEERNVVLSEYRARAVASGLRARRVPSAQIGIEAHGSAEPLSEGTDSQALALDRRAELRFAWGPR